MRNAPKKTPVDGPKEIGGAIIMGILLIVIGLALLSQSYFFSVLILLGIALIGQSFSSMTNFADVPEANSSTNDSVPTPENLRITAPKWAFFAQNLLHHDYFFIHGDYSISKAKLIQLLNQSERWAVNETTNENHVSITVGGKAMYARPSTFDIRWSKDSKLNVTISQSPMGLLLCWGMCAVTVYFTGFGAFVIFALAAFVMWVQFQLGCEQLRKTVLSSLGGTSHNSR
ncbi:MAG: hypothetical protein JNM27_19970 [Leptospirales bacterium]|nr:hypothetical protein [Leptospirales bacterium]